MKEIVELFHTLTKDFGLSTTLLLLIALGEAVIIRYVYLEWRKDVKAFTDAAKGMSDSGAQITAAVSSLGHSLAEIRGALFVGRGNSEGQGR